MRYLRKHAIRLINEKLIRAIGQITTSESYNEIAYGFDLVLSCLAFYVCIEDSRRQGLKKIVFD